MENKLLCNIIKDDCEKILRTNFSKINLQTRVIQSQYSASGMSSLWLLYSLPWLNGGSKNVRCIFSDKLVLRVFSQSSFIISQSISFFIIHSISLMVFNVKEKQITNFKVVLKWLREITRVTNTKKILCKF